MKVMIPPYQEWSSRRLTFNQYWPKVDHKALYEAMKHVKQSPEEAQEKAKAAQEWVKKNLSFNAIRKQGAEILK